MEPFRPIVHRKRLLTNEPAEFVENGAAFRVLRRHAEPGDDLELLEDFSEYSPHLDKFVRQGAVLDISVYYRQSEKRKQHFQRKLETFATLLQKDLGGSIEIRDPKDIDLTYALRIIDEIGQHNERKRPYKRFLKTCFRKYQDNKVIVDGILSLVPDDLYGSLISGGFTLILACLERHGEKGEAIANFLDDIQENLDGIKRLTDIHYESDQVHSQADAILVSVFNILELILDKMTNNFGNKQLEAVKKVKGSAKSFFRLSTKKQSDMNGNFAVIITEESSLEAGSINNIPAALEYLQKQVENFQAEVDIVEKERIGNIDRNVRELKQQGEDYPKAMLWLFKQMKDSNQKDMEEIMVFFKTTLYNVLRSDSFIIQRTAQVDHKEMEQSMIEQVAKSRRRIQKRNNHLTSKWLSGIHGEYDAMVDLKDCVEYSGKLDIDEKNVFERIVSSEDLNDWLQDDQSSLLIVDLETPPNDLNNPLSLTSALLTMALRSTGRYPVLAFFCKHRNNEFADEKKSGPVAMIRSLNGQLMDFINKKRPEADLSQVEGKYFLSKSRTTVKHGISLFKGLLNLLPDKDTVFIILDSLSCLSGEEKEGNSLMKVLNRVMKSKRRISIRVLATDPLADSPLRDIACWQLYVPDIVSGADVIDIEATAQKLRKLHEDKNEDSDGSDDDDDEDDNEDSESSDEDEDEDEDSESSDDDEGED